MKILMVTNQYPNSRLKTTNLAVFYQARDLRKLGVDIEIYYIDSNQRKILAYTLLIFQLLRKWKTGNYDLMHIQFGGIQALIGSLIAKKKSIITFHGTDLHGGTPLSLYQKISRRILTWCSRSACKFAGKIIVVSSNLFQYLPRQAMIKAITIPTGVDYDFYSPQSKKEARAELNLASNRKYVLFSDISSSAVKRLDIAKAVEERVRLGDPDARLLLMNQQPHEMVPLFLNASDCLLLTSDKEGSPNIVKEALAVNLPVVSIDVGDVALRCKDVPNCQIVNRSIEELAQAVLRAFEMHGIQGGRLIKQQEIDNKIIVKEIFSVYDSMMKSN